MGIICVIGAVGVLSGSSGDCGATVGKGVQVGTGRTGAGKHAELKSKTPEDKKAKSVSGPRVNQ
jgi:hypothetical protein